ncbi:MAG: bifunctional riboflavin kinase/FAD synthetase [Wenzhouxiangella sp.]
MDLIRTLYPSPEAGRPVALTIGNFDGLHRGHQALIGAVVERAPDLVPALMCFEPLPATLFRADRPVPRLLGVTDRIQLARRLGLQRLYMARFNRAFAALEPDVFLRDIVAAAIGARHVVVGADFRFGARAAGDVALLARLGRRLGFGVEVIEPVCQGAQKISSSRIRSLLAAGDLDAAAALLGRPYSLSGRVLHGQQLGRRLGFPTVNLRPPTPPALQGVFAVRVSGPGLDAHPGVANLGRRPTVNGSNWLLEVHLFDYDDNLYGQRLEVEFLQRLRGEEKFPDLAAMTRQMQTDALQARRVLAAAAVAS